MGNSRVGVKDTQWGTQEHEIPTHIGRIKALVRQQNCRLTSFPNTRNWIHPGPLKGPKVGALAMELFESFPDEMESHVYFLVHVANH